MKKIGSIEFYNDSASTIPEPTAAALRSFPGKDIILIAGGRSKVKDYSPIAKALRSAHVPLVILYGENKRAIALALRRIKNKELRIMEVDNLGAAVRYAYIFAKKSLIHHSLFIILLSPASQSFDQFKNYADRGEQFKEIVRT